MFLRCWTIGWTAAVAAAVGLVAVIAPGVASARQPARPVVLKTKFTKVAGISGITTTTLKTSGPYVLVDPTFTSQVLFDDQTGKQLPIPGGCTATTFGDQTLALDCQNQQTLQGTQTLYRVPSGQSSTIKVSTPGECGTVGQLPCPSVSDIGADWVQVTSTTEDQHPGFGYEYVNRTTGRVVAQPTSPKLNVDLNSPKLTARVCKPLSIPHPTDGNIGAGTLTAVGGGFQIASGNQSYLERCGTQLRLPVGCNEDVCTVAHNAHSVVWATSADNDPSAGRLKTISGVFLPSLQRFTIKPPTDATGIPEVAFTNKHLYVMAGGSLWRSPTPTPKKH
jgi:hypothetical protein